MILRHFQCCAFRAVIKFPVIFAASRENGPRGRFVIRGSIGVLPIAFGVIHSRTRQERVRFQPKHAGGNSRIDARLFPPRGFIATAMDLTMMAPAQWHGEFIADLTAKRTVLGETQMMGSEGRRPQIRQGSLITNRTWSRLRIWRSSVTEYNDRKFRQKESHP